MSEGYIGIFNSKYATNTIVEWISDWFKQNGPECNAVVGISGGVDSSVVAALLVKAIGKERVLGVLMPNGEQKDINYAKKLCEFLGIKNITVNIYNVFNSIKDEISHNLWVDELSKQTIINLPPRIRMTTLYAVSQSVNGRVANTCNLSEDWIGYSTRYGDSVGDFSPLSMFTKTEVKAIGRILGLPDELVDKTPDDGLCGKTDEENFGFTYEVLDAYIRTGKIENRHIKDAIDYMHEKNKFKLKPMPQCPFYTLNNKEGGTIGGWRII